MGELILLAPRRAEQSRRTASNQARRQPAGLGATPQRRRSSSLRASGRGSVIRAFYFDPTCPFSYMATERVERVMGDVDWVPVSATDLTSQHPERLAAVRAHAETCAVALRLPLVWPDRTSSSRVALRAAVYARELGRSARFALAASRLVFCGGFDLEDPEILAEAAAAAGIPLQGCLAAVRDERRDEQLLAAAHRLAAAGINQVPAIRLGHRWLAGEQALAEAAALSAPQTVRPQLAPAG